VRIYRHSSKARIRHLPPVLRAELTEKTFWQGELELDSFWAWVQQWALLGIIVGQILYTSVSENLKEFGTLKAMGASDRVIYSVIVEQALWMAILGYLPGMFFFGVELGRMQLRAS